MKYILLILVVFLCFLSCEDERKTKIIISNNTHTIIDSLKLTYGTETEYRDCLFYKINPKEKVNKELNMNFKGIDGGYTLDIFKEGETTGKYFGYYSNAVFKNSTIYLTIEKDTILIKRELIN